ncbi:hAT family C-terminal dimerization region [Phytophthora infestans]|uniref:HAT family C-terminal dimerization region n=1 Tax=Phytophthora infestans TaxID=4787 RepID=A0A8S9U2V6_PHYIN|nr:hAT family C-terminal dimerization region [Phytophthora infestans]
MDHDTDAREPNDASTLPRISEQGRPQDSVWSEFDVVVPRWSTPKKQHPDVQCKYCAKTIRHAQPKKNLRPHIRCCHKAPNNVRSRYPPTPAKRSRDGESETRQHKRARSEGEETRAVVPRLYTKSEIRAFHHEVASAFYSSAIPFRVVENPKMRHILTKYCPGMPLPSRQDLASALLDDAYREERANVELVLRSQTYVTVATDGWSDPNSESIINFMITSPFMRPIFWCSIRTGEDRHTGMYMASALAKVIKEVEEIVGKGAVAAVVTDNAANMRKSWEILVKRIPSLTCNGCSAHTLNLLLKDMFGIEFMRDVLNKAVAITKFVRKRPALLYYFRSKQRQRIGSRQHRRSLILPVSTRWYSSTNCISSVVKNEEVLRAVFRNDSLLDRYGNAAAKLQHVQEILADSHFWTRARTVLRLVEPETKALGALEKDGCCLSMVYHYFRGLQYNSIYAMTTDDVAEGVLTTIRGQIRSRWRILQRESVLAAFLLDPSKHIAEFEDSDLIKAVKACVALALRVGLPSGVSAQAFRQAVLRFVRMKESWSPEEHAENAVDAPLDWWLLYRKKLFVLYTLATRVLSIPTSSAASERSWSVHSFIHSKRRNRLKPERVEKLAFVYSNSGDKDATSCIHYMEVEQDASDSEVSDDASESGDESPSAAHRSRMNGARVDANASCTANVYNNIPSYKTKPLQLKLTRTPIDYYIIPSYTTKPSQLKSTRATTIHK